ncbi:MAG: hypothetical protein RLZZ436_1611, partial [Planctomycetota bacterium]
MEKQSAKPKKRGGAFYRAAGGRRNLFREFRGNFQATRSQQAGQGLDADSFAQGKRQGHPDITGRPLVKRSSSADVENSVFLSHVAGFATLCSTHDFATFGAAFGLFGQLGFGTRTEDHGRIPGVNATKTPENCRVYRQINHRTIADFRRETAVKHSRNHRLSASSLPAVDTSATPRYAPPLPPLQSPPSTNHQPAPGSPMKT